MGMLQDIIDKIVIDSLDNLKSVNRKEISFPKLLSKANPYELAVRCNTVQELIDFVMTSHKQTSSQTIWGNYLELIALQICKITLGGNKSQEESTDFEYTIDGKINYRGWKSSPNWANSDQKRAVNDKESTLSEGVDFGSFKVLTSYGKTPKVKKKKGFTQLSGQLAWEEISGGDSEMYSKVMIAINTNKEVIGQFIEKIYISNMYKTEKWITDNFVNEDGTINFIKINNYVSSNDKVTITKW